MSKRMTLWRAVRFVWHYRWSPSWHADGTYYDEQADVVRCPCGKTWPPR